MAVVVVVSRVLGVVVGERADILDDSGRAAVLVGGRRGERFGIEGVPVCWPLLCWWLPLVVSVVG